MEIETYLPNNLFESSVSIQGGGLTSNLERLITEFAS